MPMTILFSRDYLSAAKLGVNQNLQDHHQHACTTTSVSLSAKSGQRRTIPKSLGLVVIDPVWHLDSGFTIVVV